MTNNTSNSKLFMKYLPILLAVFILIIFAQGNSNSDRDKTLLSSNKIMEVVYPSALENTQNISTTDLLGKKYVLHFFATWCGYCIKEHKMLLKMQEKLPIYAVGWKDSLEDLKALLQNGNPYTNVGMDPYGTISNKLGISVIPQTFVINEKGEIIFHKVGLFDPNELLKFFK